MGTTPGFQGLDAETAKRLMNDQRAQAEALAKQQGGKGHPPAREPPPGRAAVEKDSNVVPLPKRRKSVPTITPRR